jgi:hypothetical protein
MTEPSSRRPSQTTLLALGLLILGGILLLRTLGVLSWGSLELLFRFWPLVAIGFGLDLLGLKTGRNISFGMLSVLLLGALVLLGPALGLSGRTVEETFRAPLERTQSAVVQLDLGAAPSRVSILADQRELFSARVIDQGRVNFSVRGNEHKTVRLGSRGRPFGFGNGGGRWDVALTPEVPLELGVDAGSGQTELDLWGLELSALELEGGSGTLDLALPASEAPYEATLDSGSGRTTLTIEDGATLELEVDGGSGALAMTFGENVAASVELDGGSGPMTFTLPDDSEARFEVEDSGSGSITVDPRLTQIESDDDEGVWETAGFAEAERAVTIRLEDGSSGSVQVR